MNGFSHLAGPCPPGGSSLMGAEAEGHLKEGLAHLGKPSFLVIGGVG